MPSSSRSVNDPGGLAGCEQKLVNQDLRRQREGGGEKIQDIMLDFRLRLVRARVSVYACALLQQGVVSTGWPDTGVSFRGCLGNEA